MPDDSGVSPKHSAWSSQEGAATRRTRARFGPAANHAGIRSPVAFRIGRITRAMRSGAASTLACVDGSFSHSANA
jgi:hypothetical protein